MKSAVMAGHTQTRIVHRRSANVPIVPAYTKSKLLDRPDDIERRRTVGLLSADEVIAWRHFRAAQLTDYLWRRGAALAIPAADESGVVMAGAA